MTLETLFTNIANAIRAKKGSSATIKPTNFATEIQNLPSQGTYQSKTVTPSSSTQVVAPDSGYDALSSVTVNGDNDLVASNIKKDVEIFGVTGTYEGGGTNNANINGSAIASHTGTSSSNYLLNQCLTKIPAINTSAWTSTYRLYYNCRNVEDIDLNINTNNVTTTKEMFYNFGYNSTNLFPLNLNNLNTSKVQDMSSMFNGCGNNALNFGLQLNDWNVSQVTNMLSMFQDLAMNSYTPSYELDLHSWVTSSATNMSSMFYNRGNQNGLWKIHINNFDTSKVTTMSDMFKNIGATKKRVNEQSVNCELHMGTLDMGACTNVSNMFSSCRFLELHGTMRNLGKAYTQARANYSSYTWDFSDIEVLTHDNLTDIINGLYDLNITYDVAGGGTLYSQKLTLGSTNLAMLSAEEIAVATAKGWNVS